MKRTLKNLFLALAAACALTSSAQAQTRIAVIDLKKVFEGYWRTKQADTQLKARAEDFEKARTGMVDDYKKATEEFKKLLESTNDQSATADERDKRKKDAEKKQNELREIETSIRTFNENSQKAIFDQRNRMRESVLRDIRGVVEEKAKAAGYALVIDTAAETVNQTQVVLYTSLLGTNDDLTEGVLKQLNANAPADFGKEEKKDDGKKDEPKKDDKK